jgi:putative ABC transport system permease protein
MFASRYSGYGEPLLRRGEKVFYEGCVRLVDSDFFHIFSFPFIRGNPKTALADVHSIVISEVTAAKYFPGEDPLGKSITMNDERDLTVTGVMQNTPEHSTLEFDMAISYDIYIEEAKRNGQNPHS